MTAGPGPVSPQVARIREAKRQLGAWLKHAERPCENAAGVPWAVNTVDQQQALAQWEAGVARWSEGRYGEAEALLREVRDFYRMRRHGKTLWVYHDLASLLADMLQIGLKMTPEKVYAVTELCEAVVGGWVVQLQSFKSLVQQPVDPKETVGNLTAAECHRELTSEGEYLQPHQLDLEAHVEYKVSLNKYHISLGNLGIVYAMQERPTFKAASLLRDSVAFLNAKLDPRDPEYPKLPVFSRILKQLPSCPAPPFSRPEWRVI